MTDRDEIWVDLTQLDTQAADAVWDGTHRDPDAPAWYRDLRSVIHRAKGPAEAHELADEPELVETMHRATLGETLARLPRSSGARTLGRVLAMKAAAATTATMISVAAAAAATTGIMATVAATVVVPVVKDHVVPMINDHLTPTVAAPAEVPANNNVGGTVSHEPEATEPLAAPPVPAAEPVDTVEAPAPLVAPDLAVTTTLDPLTTEAGETPAEPPPVVDPAPVDPALPAVDPAPTDPPAETMAVNAAPVDPAPVDAAPPAVDPAPSEPAPAPPAVDPAPADPAPPADQTPDPPKPDGPGHSEQAPGHADPPPGNHGGNGQGQDGD